MSTQVIAVIPARLGSRRFKRKVLHPYQDKPLLFYVWDSIRKSRRIDRLLIATDSKEIMAAVSDFGAEAVMTSARLKTGTDRMAEVARRVKGDIYVNVQADNIGLKASVLDRMIDKFKAQKSVGFGTMARRIGSDDELFDPDKVKVIFNRRGEALWFSRFPLPYLQGAVKRNRARQFVFWEHIGIYFMRRPALLQFTRWGRSDLEKAESLEQLRVLENGAKMAVYPTTMKTVSIDSPMDLERLPSLR